MTTQPRHRLSSKQVFVVCVLLFGLVLWTFLPALHNGFINYDDDVYVTANTHVQGGLTWSNVAWAFENTDASNWHPLTWLSHMTDCELFGLNPQGHHLTSVLLHAINAVLLFLMLRRMTSATWRSLFVAAVFGLHPLRVESVVWIAERKDVLSMLFGLLSLLMYTVYAERRLGQKGKPWIFYILALLCFLLSLMSKPMLVTLPFVLLLLDYWPLNRFKNASAWKLVQEKTPFLLLVTASCVVTFIAQRRGGAMELMAGISFTDRCENALVSYCRYLGKLFWPDHLAIIYPVTNHWTIPIVILAAILLLALTVGTIVAHRFHPYLMVGWFWFLGTLVPVIGLVAVGEQAMADRYSYLPLIGVLIMVTWGTEEMTRRWRHHVFGLSAVSLVTITTCILSTRQNIGYWKNSETLFRHVIAVTDDNYSAHCNLGNSLLTQGRMEEALVELQAAVTLKPDSPQNLCNLGTALADLGRMDEAIIQFQKAEELRPDYGPAHHNLGMALEQKNQLDKAMSEYQKAVELMPSYAPAHNSLGIALAKNGHLDEAITQFQEAMRLDPSLIQAQKNLKMALELKGH